MSDSMNQGRQSWLERKRSERGKRALERQLDYQRHKSELLSGVEEDLVRQNFLRAQYVRRKLDAVRAIQTDDRILEVGSGAHGLVFGLGARLGVGIDPLAVEYRSLFPKHQGLASTAAAIGEQLPFADGAFDVVLSDNVIDHAADPLAIVDEIIRVTKSGGAIYFTVNIHHPLYQFASAAHGLWNALGLKLELSAFADHTIHLTEARIAQKFRSLPVRIVEQNSTAESVSREQRSSGRYDPDGLLKRFFFKNALFEMIAIKN